MTRIQPALFQLGKSPGFLLNLLIIMRRRIFMIEGKTAPL